MSRHGDLPSRFARLPLTCSAAGLIVAVALLRLAAPAEAATYTWKNATATTDFNSAANWNTTLPGASDYGVFSGSATVQPALTANATVAGLLFSGSTYTLSGAASTLTLASVATGSGAAALTFSGGNNTVATNLFLSATSGTQQFYSSFSGTNSVSGTISGGNAAARLYLDGASTVRVIALSNTTNSFTSGVVLGSVTARVASIGMANGNSSLGTSGTVTFLSSYLDYTGSGETSDKHFALAGGNGSEGRISNATGPLTLTGNFFSTTAGAKTLAFNPSSVGTITATGTISDGSSGSLTVYIGPNTGGAVATLTNPNNSFSGGVTIRGAALAAPQFGMSGFNSPLGTSGTIRLGDSSLGTATAHSLIYTGFGETTNKRLAFGGNAIAMLPTLTQNGEGTLTLSDTNPILHSNAFAKTFTLSGSGVGVLAAVIGDVNGSGTARTSLTKSGAGTWTLTGSNTYAGNTAINGGILRVANLPSSGTLSFGAGGGALAGSGGTLTVSNPVGILTQGAAFTGSESITLTGTLQSDGARTITNTIAGAGKRLTIGGLMPSTSGASRSFILDGTGNASIGPVMNNTATGTMGLELRGSGTTTLTAANTMTGTTSVRAGTLVADFTENNAAANKIGSNLTFGGGSHYDVGAAFVISGTADGPISIGTVSVNPGFKPAHYSFRRQSSTTVLQVTSALSRGNQKTTFDVEPGMVVLTTGTSNFQTNGAIPFMTAGNDWATLSGVTTGTIQALASYVPLATTGAISGTNYLLQGSASYNGSTASVLPTLKIVSTGNDQSLSIDTSLRVTSWLYAGGGNGNYAITGSGTFDPGVTDTYWFVNSGTLTMNVANWANASNIQKSGTGTLVWNSTRSGTVSVQALQGALRLGSSLASGTSGALNVIASPAGSALELTNNIAIPSGKTHWIYGRGIADGGAIRNVSGSNSMAGVITVANSSGLLQDARINADAGTQLTLSGGVVTASKNDVVFGGAGTVIVDTAAISGAGNLTKDGAGRLELKATNTYTGLTTVSAGELKVNGSIAASTAGVTNPFYVAAGATVSGTGTIASQAYFDGTLAPGNSPGTITYTNDVIWSGSSTWNFELSGTAAGQYDQALITNGGGFYRDTSIAGSDAAGYYTFDFLNTGTAGTFRLVDWSGTTNFVTANFGYQNLASGLSGTFNVDNTESALFFTVTSSGPISANYALGIGAAAQTIIQGGVTLITGTIDNTGPDGGDAIGYTGFSGTSAAGAFALSPAAGTVNSKAATTGTGSFTTNTPGLYTVTPVVASATNSILGTAATLTNTGSVQINVLAHATPAFMTTVSSTLALDFGTVAIGEAVVAQAFSLTNLSGSAGAALTASLDYLGTGADGDGFTLTGATFSSLAASSTSGQFSLAFNPTTTGTFTRTYTLSFQDGGGYSGATTASPLTVAALVVVVPEPASIVLAALGVGLAAWTIRRRRRG